MKLTANSIREKIKAQEAKRAAEESKAAELRRLEKEKSRKTAKYFKEVSEKVLSAALDGHSKVEVGVDCHEQIRGISDKLSQYFLDVDEVLCNDYLETHLRNYLETIDTEEIAIKKSLLFDSTKTLRNLIHDICDADLENQSALIPIEHSLSGLYANQMDLVSQILALHKTLIEFRYILEESSSKKYLKNLNEIKKSLRAAFDGTWLFETIYDDSVIYFIKWEILKDDDVLNYEPVDDYFNYIGLSWIASSHGQLFLSALENLVEDKIRRENFSLKMRLYKFSSGYRIELENKSEVYTLLDEVGLTRLFINLGYKVKSVETDLQDVADLEISW